MGTSGNRADIVFILVVYAIEVIKIEIHIRGTGAFIILDATESFLHVICCWQVFPFFDSHAEIVASPVVGEKSFGKLDLGLTDRERGGPNGIIGVVFFSPNRMLFLPDLSQVVVCHFIAGREQVELTLTNAPKHFVPRGSSFCFFIAQSGESIVLVRREVEEFADVL
jgi:hypothetical protein